MGRRCCKVLQGADKVARLVREFAALFLATHTRGYPCTSRYTPKHHVDGSTKHMQALCVRRWIVLEQSACTLTAIPVDMLKESRQVFMVQNKWRWLLQHIHSFISTTETWQPWQGCQLYSKHVHSYTHHTPGLLGMYRLLVSTCSGTNFLVRRMWRAKRCWGSPTSGWSSPSFSVKRSWSRLPNINTLINYVLMNFF